jgi:hypothetical protein
LFSSLDPSPFWDRDLDRIEAEFIEDEFRDKQFANVWHLHVHVVGGDTSPTDLQTAVENYYGRLANSSRIALHEHLLERGRVGLQIGSPVVQRNPAALEESFRLPVVETQNFFDLAVRKPAGR